MDMETAHQQLLTGTDTQQAAAAEALAGMGELAQQAIPALVQHCASADESVRNWCTAALEEVGPPAGRQLEHLTALAEAANSDVAYWAVTLLGRAGEQAQAAIPTLLGRLEDDSSPQVQERAAWALGKIARGSTPAISALQSAAATTGPLATHSKRALEKLSAASA
ncbi:HEAT repeat domain-containing protein [Adhaeretor mobilis]|uniref:HEAT repeat protein n=1 Tax=Adhaeretor mobilis TaxID=1930276 RepID=A0A517MY07_9BACT|nr:HEAT repeat domain-containing protein [Adhaeretor mobilis]QDS99753.1 HEAT repeat protein [Adhaeretor mobilis]